MKNQTYQQKIEVLKNLDNKIQQYNAIESIVEDMMNESERVWRINRRWQSYGTWIVSLWMNEYCYGKELTAKINKRCQIVTHDEDKEFSMSDFEDILTEVCIEYFDMYEPEEDDE